MKLLFDTHSLIWAVMEPTYLSRRARQVIEDPANILYVSSASAWEIATKVRLGKLPEAVEFEQNFEETVVDVAQYALLPLDTATALRAGRLVGAHKDPFDRMIAAQALALDIPVISKDKKLDEFGVTRIW